MSFDKYSQFLQGMGRDGMIERTQNIDRDSKSRERLVSKPVPYVDPTEYVTNKSIKRCLREFDKDAIDRKNFDYSLFGKQIWSLNFGYSWEKFEKTWSERTQTIITTDEQLEENKAWKATW